MNNNSTLNLRAGDFVEVRSTNEILSTLDSNGTLDALPLMPEMLKYAGQCFRVFKRADKTCDTIVGPGLRRMTNAVHLEGLRCDGEAHGGCEASCLFFWKEAWLKKIDVSNVTAGSGSSGIAPLSTTNSAEEKQTMTEAALRKATRQGDVSAVGDDAPFVCQTTELRKATAPMAWWDVTQYLKDVRSRNLSLGAFIADGSRQLAIWLFNKGQSLINGRSYPFWQGQLTKTPTAVLNLQPGDTVRVKPVDAIVKTLDTKNSNRGLSFNIEMVKYCGRTFKVLQRVQKIINEKTGKMMRLPNDCIILDGVTCDAQYHKFCPRSIYPYWREIWLERVDQ